MLKKNRFFIETNREGGRIEGRLGNYVPTLLDIYRRTLYILSFEISRNSSRDHCMKEVRLVSKINCRSSLLGWTRWWTLWKNAKKYMVDDFYSLWSMNFRDFVKNKMEFVEKSSGEARCGSMIFFFWIFAARKQDKIAAKNTKTFPQHRLRRDEKSLHSLPGPAETYKPVFLNLFTATAPPPSTKQNIFHHLSPPPSSL